MRILGCSRYRWTGPIGARGQRIEPSDGSGVRTCSRKRNFPPWCDHGRLPHSPDSMDPNDEIRRFCVSGPWYWTVAMVGRRLSRRPVEPSVIEIAKTNSSHVTSEHRHQIRRFQRREPVVAGFGYSSEIFQHFPAVFVLFPMGTSGFSC